MFPDTPKMLQHNFNMDQLGSMLEAKVLPKSSLGGPAVRPLAILGAANYPSKTVKKQKAFYTYY
eukprot:21383-Karenia_brevis.AAC.1